MTTMLAQPAATIPPRAIIIHKANHVAMAFAFGPANVTGRCAGSSF